MTSVWLVARAEARRRWRGLAVLVLVIAVGAGATLSLAAGARRTADVVDRFRTARSVADIIVQPDEVTDAELAALRADPAVAVAAPLAVVFAKVEGTDTEILSESQTRVAVDGTYGTGVDRPVLLRGRPLDHDDPRAVEISEAVATEQHLDPGDTLVLQSLSAGQIIEGIFEGAPLGAPAGPRLELRVSGVVRPTNELLGLVNDGGILLTRALWDEVGDPIQVDGTPARGTGLGGFANVVVVRSHPGRTDAAIAAARRVFAGDDELFVERTEEEAAGVRDLSRVVAIALGIATAIVGLATLVLAVQALARQMGARAEESAVLAAIGMGPREQVAAALAPVVGAIAVAVALASVLAAVVSSRFPFGDLRRVEPDPGIRVDGVVLAVGAVAVVVVLSACAWLVALRAQRRRAGRRARVLPAALARGPLLVSTGASLATGRRVAFRPALGAAIVALAGVAAAATFGSSLDRFVGEPVRDGWGWDAEVGMGDGFDDAAATAEAERLAARPGVDGVLLVRAGTLPVGPGGNDTQVLGLQPVSGDVGMTVLEGRAPQRPDEVALGADTAEQRDAGVGDRIVIRGAKGARPLRVTGIVRFPIVDSDNPADGLALTLDGLAEMVPRSPQDDAFGFPTTFVDLAPGIDPAEAAVVLGESPSSVTVRVKSTDVVSLEKVVGIPPVIAWVLAFLGALGLAHAVLIGIRRQRRDLAVLRALGFVRRQVSSIVGVQTAGYCAIGVLVGIPLGVVVGRWGWRLLARQLGAADDPLTPASLLLTAPATVLLIGALAVVVGRITARGRPSTVLRSE